MTRDDVINDVADMINKQWGSKEACLREARRILDFLDSIGYDPCFELRINIHNHPQSQIDHSMMIAEDTID